jgi:mRNA interferase MazF
MSPRHGEVWRVDLGLVGKVRPGVVLIADDLDAPRSLVIYVPITSQNRGSELEVPLGHLAFLTAESVANVQAIGALPAVRFERRLGILPIPDLIAIKRALVRACGLTALPPSG